MDKEKWRELEVRAALGLQRISQKTRRVFRCDGINIKARAPLETGDLG